MKSFKTIFLKPESSLLQILIMGFVCFTAYTVFHLNIMHDAQNISNFTLKIFLIVLQGAILGLLYAILLQKIIKKWRDINLQRLLFTLHFPFLLLWLYPFRLKFNQISVNRYLPLAILFLIIIILARAISKKFQGQSVLEIVKRIKTVIPTFFYKIFAITIVFVVLYVLQYSLFKPSQVTLTLKTSRHTEIRFTANAKYQEVKEIKETEGYRNITFIARDNMPLRDMRLDFLAKPQTVTIKSMEVVMGKEKREIAGAEIARYFTLNPTIKEFNPTTKGLELQLQSNNSYLISSSDFADLMDNEVNLKFNLYTRILNIFFFAFFGMIIILTVRGFIKHHEDRYLLLGFFTVYLLSGFLITAFAEVNYFQGFPFDGPFQSFNLVRRMASGQIPGYDFQFFHGLGIIYLHFYPFIFLGANFFASELSRQLISLLFFPVVNYLFIRSLKIKSSVALAFTLILSFAGTLLGLWSISIAGNSLMGIRSTFPLLTMGIFLLTKERIYDYFSRWQSSSNLLTKFVSRFIVEIVLTFCVAIIFFFSVEQGSAAIVTLILTLLFFPPFSKQSIKGRLISLGVGAITLTFFISTFYFTTTGPTFYKPILYALKDIPTDQFWYFGAPPNAYAAQLSDLISDNWFVFRFALALFVLLPFSIYLYWKKPGQRIVQSILIFLLIQSMISSMVAYLGIQFSVYSEPLMRVEILTMLYYGYSFLVAKVDQKGQKYVDSSFLILFYGVLICILLIYHPFFNKLTAINSLVLGEYLKEVQGVRLSTIWTQDMEILKEKIPKDEAKRDKIWSAYSGILEAEYNIFHPDTDYIIHALGKNMRDQYLSTFSSTEPLYVTTSRLDYPGFGHYSEWLHNTSWNFYHLILLNYNPIGRTSHSIIWKKKRGEWREIKKRYIPLKYKANETDYIDLPIDNNKLNPGGENVILVHLEYKIYNPYQKIPLLGSLTRFLLYPRKTISWVAIALPPYENEITFPLRVNTSEEPYLRLKIAPYLPGVKLEIQSIGYRPLEVDQKTVQYFMNPSKIPED